MDHSSFHRVDELNSSSGLDLDQFVSVMYEAAFLILGASLVWYVHVVDV